MRTRRRGPENGNFRSWSASSRCSKFPSTRCRPAGGAGLGREDSIFTNCGQKPPQPASNSGEIRDVRILRPSTSPAPLRSHPTTQVEDFGRLLPGHEHDRDETTERLVDFRRPCSMSSHAPRASVSEACLRTGADPVDHRGLGLQPDPRDSGRSRFLDQIVEAFSMMWCITFTRFRRKVA
jgi:hypothetical protein